MTLFSKRELIFLLLIACVPVLGYEFGFGNQVEQFAIVRRMADPGYIPADFYTNSASQFGPRFYYSQLVALFTRAFALPAVIFVFTWLTNLTLAAVTMDAAKRHLGASPIGGAIAAMTVLAGSSFSLGYASYVHFEVFQPASPAIALALLGFSLMLAGRRVWAVFAFAAASLMHPLIGVEVAAIAFAACAFAEVIRERSPATIWRAWLRYVPAGLVFSAIIAVVWVAPTIGADAPRIPDAEFFQTLAVFRAPHHYLGLEMPKYMVLRAGLYFLAISWIALIHFRSEGLKFAPAALAIAGLGAVGLCCLSVLLVDLLHNREATTLQLFRMLLVLKWVGRLFFAWIAARWLMERKVLPFVCAAAPVLVAGEAQPYVMLVSVVVMQAASSLRLHRVVQYILAACVLALAGYYAWQIGDWQVQERAWVAFPCVLAFFWFERPRFALHAAAVALVAALIAFTVVNRDQPLQTRGGLFRVNFGWGDLKSEGVEIARWAGANSPPGSLWITPPELEAFRLVAERAVVVDFTCVPFEDLALRGWRERMRDLYGDVEGGGFNALAAMRRNYHAGNPQRLQAAARKYGASYAVLYSDTPWSGPVLFDDGAYKAVKLSEAAP